VSANPQIGDIGLELIITITTCDCDGNTIPLDISTETLKKICLKKPDTTVVEFDAEFTLPTCGAGDGSDGKLSYITQAGDLDAAGVWCIAGRVTLASGQDFRTSFQTFKVEDPICP
jgi:hypothetical protein